MERTNDNPHIVEIRCDENNYFPNNNLPVLIYKKAFDLPAANNKAVKFVQQHLATNGWGSTLR